jgi:hypothetical protein
MPVIIKSTRKPMPARKGRGGHFDQSVKELAATINQLRLAGTEDIRSLADKLNEMGLSSPTGKAFSYGGTQRFLFRMKAMGLGEGPRTKRQAANDRAKRAASSYQRTAQKLSRTILDEFQRLAQN